MDELVAGTTDTVERTQGTADALLEGSCPIGR